MHSQYSRRTFRLMDLLRFPLIMAAISLVLHCLELSDIRTEQRDSARQRSILTFNVKTRSTESTTFLHRVPNVLRKRRRTPVDVGSSSLPRAQAPTHARPRPICLNSRRSVKTKLKKRDRRLRSLRPIVVQQLNDIGLVLGYEDAFLAWSARACVARLSSMHRSVT